MGKLSELPNIGKEIERQLNEVNITTAEELRAVGAEQAWLRIQKIDSSACINRLMGLEGAVCGVKKAFLPDERKAELKEFYNRHKIPRR
jgi:DNA transformation protein